MAQDALSQGLHALAIQLRHPLQALRFCRESGIRAILNHRLNRNSPTGHYTVLVDIDDANVLLHDPFFGPWRRLAHAQLMELWQPRFPNSEIAGNVIIGITPANPPEVTACEFCRTRMLAGRCPSCKKPVGLQPVALLGCKLGPALPACGITFVARSAIARELCSAGTATSNAASDSPATPKCRIFRHQAANPAAAPAPARLVEP